MATRTDLRLMAAEEAGVIAAGETLGAADQDYIDRRTVSKLADLERKGLTPFDIEGTIPDAYLLPLARVLAAEIAPGFGLDLSNIKPLAEESMRVLRELKAGPYLGTVQATTYY